MFEKRDMGDAAPGDNFPPFQAQFEISKLNAIEPDSGIISSVFVYTTPGTTLELAKGIPGFIPNLEIPIAVNNKRHTVFQGMFDTSGSNLLDATALEFVSLIEGEIKFSADI